MHGDLRPSSLKLKGILKINGFGKPFEQFKSGEAESYESPEMLSGLKHYKSDVWSLGVILFELAT